MYKIGIIGSAAERFGDPDKVRRAIGYTIDHVGYQYQDVVFHISADIGTGLWAAGECMERGYKYHLFMPFSPEETCRHWYEDQQKELFEQYNNAYSLTVCRPDGGADSESHMRPIDDTNFVVCFWPGEKAGKTAEAIKYAFSNNKIVLDGLNDLRLITNKDLRKNKTWKKD